MGRPPRQLEVATERRRRKDSTLDRTAHLKLAISDEVRKNNPNKTFRWVNDTPGRMHALTVNDDWDKVDGVDPIPVGQDQSGQPIYARLCAKPLEFWEEDQKAKADAIRAQQKELIREGKAPQIRADETSYVAAGNTIKTEGYTP